MRQIYRVLLPGRAFHHVELLTSGAQPHLPPCAGYEVANNVTSRSTRPSRSFDPSPQPTRRPAPGDFPAPIPGGPFVSQLEPSGFYRSASIFLPASPTSPAAQSPPNIRLAQHLTTRCRRAGYHFPASALLPAVRWVISAVPSSKDTGDIGSFAATRSSLSLATSPTQSPPLFDPLVASRTKPVPLAPRSSQVARCRRQGAGQPGYYLKTNPAEPNRAVCATPPIRPTPFHDSSPPTPSLTTRARRPSSPQDDRESGPRTAVQARRSPHPHATHPVGRVPRPRIALGLKEDSTGLRSTDEEPSSIKVVALGSAPLRRSGFRAPVSAPQRLRRPHRARDGVTIPSHRAYLRQLRGSGGDYRTAI